MSSSNHTPPGFVYFPNFLTLDEEKELIHNLQKLEWQSVKMYGVVAKRKVIHYGLDYHFQSRKVHPTTTPPHFLDFIIEKASYLLEVNTEEILEVLLSHYSEGAGIGWHKDAPMFDKIFGVSLGHPCVMKFRKKQNPSEVIKLKLDSSSAYVLTGAARELWEHCIPPVKLDRYSITLRTLKSDLI